MRRVLNKLFQQVMHTPFKLFLPS